MYIFQLFYSSPEDTRDIIQVERGNAFHSIRIIVKIYNILLKFYVRVL